MAEQHIASLARDGDLVRNELETVIQYIVRPSGMAQGVADSQWSGPVSQAAERYFRPLFVMVMRS